jgi:hypothetical protein
MNNIHKMYYNPKPINNNNNNNNNCSKTVTLFSQPYLDQYSQCYKNIITLNNYPRGPLFKYVKKINFPPLSTFKQQGDCNRIKTCGLVLTKLNNNCYNICNNDLMVVDDVPDLLSFLLENGYTVDTSITKMLNNSDIRFDTNNGNKIICLITFNG